MRKEVSLILIIILLVPVSYGQLNSIEIKDVNINDNSIQVLVQNNMDKDFNKITFIINNQYTIIQEEILSNFTTKFFVVNYRAGIKLETIKVIVGDQLDDYVFTGNEDRFVVNQEVSSITSTIESNSPVSYIYSNQRLAKIQDGNVLYFSSDNIGSTSIETDNSGSVSFKSNYLPFAKEISFSSINNEKYGFTGKEFDTENSLNYFNARYYNPNNGKFISNDPIFKPSEGGYQYVRNNPLTITDPSGNDPCVNSCPGANFWRNIKLDFGLAATKNEVFQGMVMNNRDWRTEPNFIEGLAPTELTNWIPGPGEISMGAKGVMALGTIGFRGFEKFFQQQSLELALKKIGSTEGFEWIDVDLIRKMVRFNKPMNTPGTAEFVRSEGVIRVSNHFFAHSLTEDQIDQLANELAHEYTHSYFHTQGGTGSVFLTGNSLLLNGWNPASGDPSDELIRNVALRAINFQDEYAAYTVSMEFSRRIGRKLSTKELMLQEALQKGPRAVERWLKRNGYKDKVRFYE